MTNEQTAVMLSGILSSLDAAIESAKELIDPEVVANSQLAILTGNAKLIDTYPQLSEIETTRNELDSQIAMLLGLSPVFA